MRGLATAERRRWWFGQEIAVDHRIERCVLGVSLRRKQLVRRYGAKSSKRRCADAVRKSHAFGFGLGA